jgi:aminocarboxymuconate-semialdehyde decarboxylase
MKIDIHTHILPEHIPNYFQKFGYGEFIHLDHSCPHCAKMIKGDKVFREIEPNCWDPAVRIKEMDMTEVDIQVLSTVPVLFNYWAKWEHGLETSRFFNDHIASCVEMHPQKFIGLGTVPLQNVDAAIKEMERCVQNLHLNGLEIGSNINQINLGDPQFEPFWEAAQALDCPIFIHPWEMMGEKDIQKYWLPWLVGMPAETTRAICSLIFSGVIERYPRLRFAFAHGGGSFAYTIGRIQHGFDVRPDLCAIDNAVSPKDYLGKFWVDSLVHDPLAFQLLHQAVGTDKICIGSDYPFPLGEALFNELTLSDDALQKFQYKNALSWLNIDAQRFSH